MFSIPNVALVASLLALISGVVAILLNVGTHKAITKALNTPNPKIAELEQSLQAIINGVDPSLQSLAGLKKWTERYYTPDSSLAEYYATKEGLAQAIADAIGEIPATDTSGFERKADRALRALQALLDYLKGMHTLTIAQARDPIVGEMGELNRQITGATVPTELQDRKREADRGLAEIRRVRMVEKPTEDQLDQEAAAYVKALGLKTSRERSQAHTEYLDNRPAKFTEYQTNLQGAEREARDAQRALDEFKRSHDISDAETRLAELREQLGKLDEAGTALATIERALAVTPPPAPSRGGSSRPPPPGGDANPGGEPDLKTLGANSSRRPSLPPRPAGT